MPQTTTGLVTDHIPGVSLVCTVRAAPVQFEGVLGEHVAFLYFRARYNGYECVIADTPEHAADYRTLDAVVGLYVYREGFIGNPEGGRRWRELSADPDGPDGDAVQQLMDELGQPTTGDFAASHLDHSEAARLMLDTIREYAVRFDVPDLRPAPLPAAALRRYDTPFRSPDMSERDARAHTDAQRAGLDAFERDLLASLGLLHHPKGPSLIALAWELSEHDREDAARDVQMIEALHDINRVAGRLATLLA